MRDKTIKHYSAATCPQQSYGPAPLHGIGVSYTVFLEQTDHSPTHPPHLTPTPTPTPHPARRPNPNPVNGHGLCKGQSATFQYRLSWKKTAGIKSVTLESGDALIFGSRSRGIIHGVPGLIPRGGTATASTRKPAAAASVSGAEVRNGRARDGTMPLGEEKEEEELCSDGVVVEGGGRYNLNFREL